MSMDSCTGSCEPLKAFLKKASSARSPPGPSVPFFLLHSHSLYSIVFFLCSFHDCLFVLSLKSVVCINTVLIHFSFLSFFLEVCRSNFFFSLLLCSLFSLSLFFSLFYFPSLPFLSCFPLPLLLVLSFSIFLH
ncbi:hypothetical protein K457DRAFT_763833 [Linnemannia elongata AG-77]|uniref:Uncharacterized protein n=1 Tax=Linnemannia elongata AG-77 TaxID=1314771 RepID=A0A197K9K4_9FUNG|nr:hypothetical protein K457DRAFT_763833 [Linnemannia elongata AG-77]